MKIDSIRQGIVLDHIKAGRSMDIYHYLHLDRLDCSVAIIKNVKSRKMGKKDIIKIDDDIDINLDVLGYIDPDITVNIIRDGMKVEKRRLSLPGQVINVVKCKNPRCVTQVEDVPHVFRLSDAESGTYRCIYCETKAKK